MSSSRKRPDLVLIVLDALRPDHLGCYGYARDTSPRLDRFAAEAARFADVTTQATWTLPALAGLLTSTAPLLMGLLSDGGQPFLAPERPNLAHLPPVDLRASLQVELRKLGYRTLACLGGGFAGPRFGFAEGFDWFSSPRKGEGTTLAAQLAAVQEQFAATPDQPRFLFLHTYEIHNYFQGHRHDLDRFSRGYTGPLTDPAALARAALGGPSATLTAEDLQYLIDLYDGEIHHTDAQLGAFLAWLKDHSRDAVIAITSDHGEAFGEHGQLGHGQAPHWEAAKVPLLLHLPNDQKRARRITTPVSLADVMPTLLEAAGGTPPAGLLGRSLLPLLAGETPEPRPALCESSGPIFLARAGRWWYYTLLANRVEKLFDLQTDPRQTQDIAAAHPEQLPEMRKALCALSAYALQGYRLVVAGPRPRALALTLECDTGFSYLLSPTLWQEGAVSFSLRHAHLRLPAGNDPHLLLFTPRDHGAAVSLSATLGEEPVPVERFHLGAAQTAPPQTPVTLTPHPSVLAEVPPAPGSPEIWGIWLWLPPRLAAPPTAQPEAARGEMEAQLRALGYLD